VDLVIVDLVKAALTPREREVAAALLEARSDSDIAQLLRIRPRTVKAHLEHICRKAGFGRDLNRILLCRVLLGIPDERLKKNRLRFRPSLLVGFRAPGGATRSMRMRARDARESQPVPAGCARIASPPAPGGAVG
jgi:DNA-binding CsgD family transcriptional regulator